jgi:hypothetical protein
MATYPTLAYHLVLILSCPGHGHISYTRSLPGTQLILPEPLNNSHCIYGAVINNNNNKKNNSKIIIIFHYHAMNIASTAKTFPCWYWGGGGAKCVGYWRTVKWQSRWISINRRTQQETHGKLCSLQVLCNEQGGIWLCIHILFANLIIKISKL